MWKPPFGLFSGLFFNWFFPGNSLHLCLYLIRTSIASITPPFPPLRWMSNTDTWDNQSDTSFSLISVLLITRSGTVSAWIQEIFALLRDFTVFSHCTTDSLLPQFLIPYLCCLPFLFRGPPFLYMSLSYRPKRVKFCNLLFLPEIIICCFHFTQLKWPSVMFVRSKFPLLAVWDALGVKILST